MRAVAFAFPEGTRMKGFGWAIHREVGNPKILREIANRIPNNRNLTNNLARQMRKIVEIASECRSLPECWPYKPERASLDLVTDTRFLEAVARNELAKINRRLKKLGERVDPETLSDIYFAHRRIMDQTQTNIDTITKQCRLASNPELPKL